MAASSQLMRRAINRSRELITQPLYDSVDVPAGAAWNADLVFFQRSAAPGSHFIITNMEQVGILPSPRTVLVKGFSAFVDPAVSGADLKFLLRNAAAVFKVNTKDYFKGPIWMLPGGGGAEGTGTDLNTNGSAQSFNIFRFQQPIVIPPMQSFSVTLKQPLATGALVVATRLTMVLWCTESRSVQ